MVKDWLSSYYHNSSKPDTSRERLWVEFEDIGLGDIIIIPGGIDWIICSKESNVKFEIFTKLNTPSYPLPIRRYANPALQLLVAKQYSLDSYCVASGWMDLSIIYFNDDDEPRRTVLEDFLPTNCFCRSS